jgi:hypothetical protein
MYCDFCGKKLPYNVKYCRNCGRQLKDCSGDTQPLPVIDEVILSNAKGHGINSAPWYKWHFNKMPPVKRSTGWRIMHWFLACGILVTMVYIVTTFQTIKEYQILVGMVSAIMATYSWWRS